MEPRWWYLHSQRSLIMRLSIRYIPVILGGIVVIVGLNVALAIRDSKMWDKLEQQRQQIELADDQFKTENI